MVIAAHGSVFDTITTSTIKATAACLGSAFYRDAFEKFAEPLFRQILSARYESRKLAELRDYLLPKLLWGRLRVRGVEGAVGEVAQ